MNRCKERPPPNASHRRGVLLKRVPFLRWTSGVDVWRTKFRSSTNVNTPTHRAAVGLFCRCPGRTGSRVSHVPYHLSLFLRRCFAPTNSLSVLLVLLCLLCGWMFALGITYLKEETEEWRAVECSIEKASCSKRDGGSSRRRNNNNDNNNNNGDITRNTETYRESPEGMQTKPMLLGKAIAAAWAAAVLEYSLSIPNKINVDDDGELRGVPIFLPSKLREASCTRDHY